MTREKLIEIIAQTEDNDNWSEYLADRIRAAYAKESQIAEPTVKRDKYKAAKGTLEGYCYGELITTVETMTKGMTVIDEHCILSKFSQWLYMRVNNLSDEISED